LPFVILHRLNVDLIELEEGLLMQMKVGFLVFGLIALGHQTITPATAADAGECKTEELPYFTKNLTILSQLMQECPVHNLSEILRTTEAKDLGDQINHLLEKCTSRADLISLFREASLLTPQLRFILRKLKTKYPTKRGLGPQDDYIEGLTAKIKEKGLRKIVEQLNIPSNEMQVLSASKLGEALPNMKSGRSVFLVHSPKISTSIAWHFTPIMMEKSNNECTAIITDSIGNKDNNRYYADEIKKYDTSCKIYYTEFRRQSDTQTCAIFALQDGLAYLKNPKLFSSIKDPSTLTKGVGRETEFRLKHLPPQLMSYSQSYSQLGNYFSDPEVKKTYSTQDREASRRESNGYQGSYDGRPKANTYIARKYSEYVTDLLNGITEKE
jgi:hypothetical protein